LNLADAASGLKAGKKAFFFAKKNQKTFAIEGVNVDAGVAPKAKVFASFFKKKRFLAARPACALALHS
jgi:hypothetical protein